MQQITILGNVGRDAVIRETNGRRAIGFSVACNESYTNQQGQKVENTTWYDCTIWREGSQGVKVADYLLRGQKVLIQGRPGVRTYTGKDGKTYAAFDVRVDKVELCGDSKAAAPAGQPVQVQEPAQRLSPMSNGEQHPATTTADDNDLPF